MYYPIQLPYILNRELSENLQYTETGGSGLVICYWQMQPLTQRSIAVKNIIAADACIDIVVDYDGGKIGFSGMSRTDFEFTIELPARFFGARLMPGAFRQISGQAAMAAMDGFLPLSTVYPDFDETAFFTLPFQQAKHSFTEYLSRKLQGTAPNAFVALFNTLSENTPPSTKELYQMLHFSPRQCQRLFRLNYGITPQMALSIIRFQKCLQILTSPQARPSDILSATNYYDQPHFINDFKRNIGLTPLELVNAYKNDAYFQ